MFRFRFAIAVVILFMLSGIALGDCVADGNDTQLDADSISLVGTVSDVVCPTDPFDFYTFNISEGSGLEGRVTFSSPQPSTVIRIFNSSTGARLVDDFSTSDSLHEMAFRVIEGSLPAGTYFVRVFFWSSAAYDHEYTLNMSLTPGRGAGCVADGNDDPGTAASIALGETAMDYLCEDDHIDYYRFSVTDSSADGRGSATLNTSPGELVAYLYDSSVTELFVGHTIDGLLEFDFGSDDGLPPGDYYLVVFLPPARTDEVIYSLNLAGWETELTIAPFFAVVAPLLDVSPWPNANGDRYNRNRSLSTGPSGAHYDSRTFDIHTDLGQATEPRSDRYDHLRIGPDGKIYFIDRERERLIAYDAETGFRREKHMGGTGPIALDDSGKVYYIDGPDWNLKCIGANGGVRWQAALPFPGNSGVSLVGRKIYVATNSFVGFYLSAFNLDGTFAWASAPFENHIAGIAEDGVGNAYVTIRDQSVLKYSPDGIILWTASYAFNIPLERIPPKYFNPVYGRDEKLWVSKPYATLVGPSGIEYEVFGSGGISLKRGNFIEDEKPILVCYGSNNGRFYCITDRNRLSCYDAWDIPRFSTPLPRPGTARSMVMGGDGKIYILHNSITEGTSGEYTYRIYTIASTTGAVIGDLQLNALPSADYMHASGELAILGDGRLAVLNGKGFLKIIDEMFFAPIVVPLESIIVR